MEWRLFRFYGHPSDGKEVMTGGGYKGVWAA